MLAKYLAAISRIAQAIFLASAIAIGVVWTIAPVRTVLQKQLHWLDDSAPTGALIAGLALLLSILSKLATRLEAQERAIEDLVALTSPNPLYLINDDQEGTTSRRDYIDTRKPRLARLIEMSANTVEPELKSLLAIGCKTTLLLMHPTALKAFPRERDVSVAKWKASIEWHIARLRHTRGDREFFPNRDLLQVLYYSAVPGFRGRHFDRRIELSWYCVRDDQPLGVVFGHCNPTLVGDTETECGRHLLRTFNASFHSMVNSAVELDNESWELAIRDVESWIKSVN